MIGRKNGLLFGPLGALIMAGTVVSVLFAFLHNPAPSQSVCADAWNVSSNSSNQAGVAHEGFSQAIVHGWQAKSGDNGCSVTFLTSEGEPWVQFSQASNVLDVTPDRWGSVSDGAWGVDSPEGRDLEVNAEVEPDGTVILRA
jgi:hypothetical protein